MRASRSNNVSSRFCAGRASMSERARWLELLPFYVNGTLNPADRRWVQEYLQRNPHLQPQLDFEEAVRANLNATVERSLEEVPTTVGLPETLSLMHARAKPNRLLEWLLSMRTDTGWRIA